MVAAVLETLRKQNAILAQLNKKLWDWFAAWDAKADREAGLQHTEHRRPNHR